MTAITVRIGNVDTQWQDRNTTDRGGRIYEITDEMFDLAWQAARRASSEIGLRSITVYYSDNAPHQRGLAMAFEKLVLSFEATVELASFETQTLKGEVDYRKTLLDSSLPPQDRHTQNLKTPAEVGHSIAAKLRKQAIGFVSQRLAEAQRRADLSLRKLEPPSESEQLPA